MTAKLTTIGAPTGGLNKRDPLIALGTNEAQTLKNIFVNNASVKVRDGLVRVARSTDYTYITDIANYIATGGGERLIGLTKSYSGGYSITEIHPTTGALSSLWGHATGTGGRLKTTQFGSYLVGVLSAGHDFTWDGTTFSASSTHTNYVDVCTYKSRIYYCDGTSLWYLGVDAIAGTPTEFPLSSLWSRGGQALCINTISRSGEGLEDMFVIVSSQGEILIYSGDYPGSSTWNLVGHYFSAPVWSPRNLVSIGNDLLLVTTAGIFSVGSIVSSNGVANTLALATTKINEDFKNAVAEYGNVDLTSLIDYNGAIYLPRNNRFYVWGGNTTTGTWFWYNQNTESGAWSKLSSGQVSPWSIAIHSNVAYMTGGAGVDPHDLTKVWNYIFKEDSSLHYDSWATSVPAAIEWDIQHAPMRFAGSKTAQFHLANIYMRHDSILPIAAGMETEFSSPTLPSVVINATPSSGNIQAKVGLNGLGHWADLRLTGSTTQNVEYIAADIMFSEGGVL